MDTCLDKYEMLMPTEKRLTNKGKEELFQSIDEYIASKIDEKFYPPTMSLKSKRLTKAEEDLKGKLMALKILLE